jgi:hypothetical protein
MLLLLLPLQLQQPSYLAGVLMTLHQIAPESDKLVELQPRRKPSTLLKRVCYPYINLHMHSVPTLTTYICCMYLLLLPLQLQQPSYLAGVLMTLHQLAPKNDKLQLQTQLHHPVSFFFCVFQPQRQ